MFEGLTGRLGDIFDRLRKRGALSEDDVNAALREVRVALLEADVALPAVKAFVNGVKERAVGQEVLRGINPGQQVIKIVHDHLVELLGSASEEINLNANPPVPVLMLGLQGSGKTTTSAKIALRLKNREKKKVLMASLDTRRPAAQEQLKVLGEQVGVATLPIVPGQTPVQIARRALEEGRLGGFDVVMLDTAGRLAIDDELMREVVEIRDATKPVESLLVVDAMTGQDAVTVATNFNERVGITGIVMTRIDGDARGGAALSMRHVTGKPIKLLGVGEKVDALEAFHPDRIAGRILGMGDVVSLVEKAAETIDREEAEKLAKKLEKGGFDLDDMLSQLRQIRKMGGMGGMMGLLPGIGKIKDQLKNANIDEGILKKQEAIILSMTKKERRNPQVLNASRRRRIALGSGTTVADVNRLVKQHQDMAEMMKKMKKLGQKGLMRQGLGALLPKGFR
ncbi:signal recognition particle protein [Aerophototrophica crusticola]|uniref:Signal recognition particle protein n=1 Tax=Aerophototrophica crusticola TaxID=1709002 RepID=A0A858R3X4_9PROT|nr:signal recognition particle protein [Rhodospirillaceae bacterium B3]